ncbi:hypothetical protein FCI23_18890 [Actinacidiphila oryziradicis]|uniref:Uncharacterized protein n=1 Tax=Actinacidiphila oryziradicis TaxID=2571141 RepID=A0A4U0T837_9ACTN|nr:hypothetical protein FCI23_18890 [Actinacidiphila oryziradicis]
MDAEAEQLWAATRRNVGDGCRGCLRVVVNRSADLYRRIEGWWCGIVVAAQSELGSVRGPM